jgi:hypothetical protein
MAADYRRPRRDRAGVANRTADRRPLHAACAKSAQPWRRGADIETERRERRFRWPPEETTMLFTILCCFSTGLTVFCILNRVNKRSVEVAVKLAVREIEKEYEGLNGAMKAQLARKEEELKKVQDKVQQLVKLHSAVPSLSRAAPPAAAAKPPSPKETAQSRKEKLKSEGLEVFAMTRPFTDTSFGELLRTTNVEKIEASGS